MCFVETHSPLALERPVESVFYRGFGGEVHQHKIRTSHLPLVDSDLVPLEMAREVQDSEA